MTPSNPYFNFNNNCREAMTFYHACFGGELYLQTVGESPMADKLSPALQGAIMHSSLASGPLVIMGSDMHRQQLVDGNSMHVCINCSSEAEIETLFAKLSEGATISDPLADTFWGAKFGSLTDKYGKQWIFNFDKGQHK